MAVTFTDIEIADLIQEKKLLPKLPHIKLKEKSGHKEQEIEILGESGNHIHEATERYQEAGFRAEHYALPTNRYKDLRDAIECLYNGQS